MSLSPRRLALAAALTLLALWCAAAPAHAQTSAPTHVVQPGENLFRIGLRYGVSVDELMRANGLTSIYIYAGQTLIIPGQAGAAPAPASTPAPVVTTGEPVYYTVQPGETLFSIGLRYNLPWTKIQVANGLAGDRVYAGQRLLIPLGNAPETVPTAAPTAAPTEAAPAATPAPTEAAPTAAPPTEAAPTPAPTEPTPAPAEAPRVHIVQPGETLFSIGLKYNLRWTTIMAANNLPDDRIFAGQQLTIPAPGTVIEPAPAPLPVQGPVSGMAGRYFLVDLSDQMLYAFEGDQLVRSTLVSTGRWPTPTVTGTYHIYARYVSTRMVGPGYDLPNVPYTQYFYQGYGLHGTYWHNNFGTPMSHGCVNMPTPEAEWAFNWASIGTPVIVQQ